MADIVELLKRKESYSHPTSDIKLIETHVSWIFLTGEYAYKVKKPVNFGFLDYSTLEKRKRFCQAEIRINSQFSDMYLEAIPVTDKGLKEGNLMDYAVKMKQMPQESLMPSLLRKGDVTVQTATRIANIIFNFHEKFRDDARENLDNLKFNWNENFSQTKVFLPEAQFSLIRRRINEFMDAKLEILQNRKAIRCHGDLHSGNIFIVEGKPYIFDAIEFNDRIAFSDPVSDVAFMAMDLEFHGRNDLATSFVASYNQMDRVDRELLVFYKCYRAYVRGKIASLSGDAQKAKEYFSLAESYAKIM